ncbi:MAG TPA: hypothetical protein VMT22_04150 [Terriglobales bacterium]|nr:hypothetical protein [Bradyrhizobium sp.]HVO92004.1 hypothetical protein [Terriglobales bacterium]
MRLYASMLLALAVLAAIGGMARADNASRPPHPDRLALIPKSKPAAPNFTRKAACGPRERACHMDMIDWCCRADQECDYRYAGGCK